MEKSNQPIQKALLKFHPALLQLLIIFILPAFFLLNSCSPDTDGINITTESGSLTSSDAKVSMEAGPAELWLSGFQGTSGSTIGPGGDLFITEGAIGAISRIDLKTGEVSTFASGLPPSIVGIGGVDDIAFIDDTAYALVTLVGPQFGTEDIVGIYRVDGPDSFTVIADIGEFALANPPETAFFVERGVQYSMEVFRDGFLVADGHHNRVLYVTLDGDISVMEEFGNIVPTGLEVRGNTIYMAEAGPVPHLPENGKIVAFGPNSSEVTTIATGARLLVDVEFGRGRSLFALSQGIWDGVAEGSPAEPNTGSLLQVNDDGTFTTVIEGLDRPTSMEFVKNTAYIVTLTGEIWTVENAASAPFGK